MNRAQFMEQLKRLLSDIPRAEREEALEYYENYFDDAGKDQEEAVIRELGSPGKVAAIIKADLKENGDSYSEYTENGYQDTRTEEAAQVPDVRQTSGGPESGQESFQERKFGRDRAETGNERVQSRAERGYHAEKKNRTGMILLIILLVFLSPAIVGASGGILGVLVAIVLLPFILVFAVGSVVFGLIVGGIACIVAGIGTCFVHAASGVFCIGIGCILLAVGCLLLIFLVWLAGKALPGLLRTVTDFCGRLLRRERKDGAEV